MPDFDLIQMVGQVSEDFADLIQRSLQLGRQVAAASRLESVQQHLAVRAGKLPPLLEVNRVGG